MNRWVLITGSAQNLGRTLALTMAKEGFPIACHYRFSEKEANGLVSEIKALGGEAAAIQGDFSSMNGLHDFIARYQKQFRGTYGLINNVGNYLIKGASAAKEGEWLDLFQTNLNAPYFITRALLDSIKRQQGRIVNIGTVGVSRIPVSHTATAYYLTKLSLWSLTQALANELSVDNVTINMVSPGYLEKTIDLKDPKKLPMRRAATFEETARAVAFFFKDESNYITGQNLEIAGGVKL